MEDSLDVPKIDVAVVVGEPTEPDPEHSRARKRRLATRRLRVKEWDPAWWKPDPETTSLWLDGADADTLHQVATSVIQWDDKSPNGYHARQPMASQQPDVTDGGVFFDARNDRSRLESDWTGSEGVGYTIFFVPKLASLPVDPHQGGGRKLMSVWNNRSNDEMVGGNCYLEAKPGGVAQIQFFYFVDQTPTTGTIYSGYLEVGKPAVLSFSTAVDAYQNGFLLGTRVQMSARTDKLSLGGMWRPGGWADFDGTIAEFIVYDGLLGSEERQRVEGYLAWKWGTQESLPVSHPYKLQRPLVTA